MDKETEIARFTTQFGNYEIVDMIYDGRPSTVLFSGDHLAAQSGIPRDNLPTMLFDYNERIMELVRAVHPMRVAVIGGGALTLPSALLSEFADIQVDVVERDEELLPVAIQYFGFRQSSRLHLYWTDASAWLEETSKQYDLVIMDVYDGSDVPPEFMTRETVLQCQRLLSRHGQVAANIISAYYGRSNTPIATLYDAYRKIFKSVKIYPASRSLISFWMPQNFILVGSQRSGAPVTLRYEPMPDPPTA